MEFFRSFYLDIRHRNSIETWSGSAILISAGTGDVNQDGFVNLIDLIEIENGATDFLTGYVPTDINGDNIVNLVDVLIDYNNSTNFITVNTP